MLRRLWKPWYVYRPSQLLRRGAAALSQPRAGYAPLPTSWGVSVLADPTKAIGRSIRTTGVYDIAVSEALARLVDPGDTVIDAGANVGYMTLLASVAAGPRGRVLSFEPHPDLFAVLQQNVAATRIRLPIARTDLRNVALGDTAGTAALVLPADFGSNDGVSWVSSGPTTGERSVPVEVDTLDRALGEESASVLKLDVEGFEPRVLRGASRALASKRIRHVVFEDHNVGQSEVVSLLEGAGYHLHALGWSVRGVELSPLEHGCVVSDYEAPNFVASIDPDEARRRCAGRGWLVMGNRLIERCR